MINQASKPVCCPWPVDSIFYCFLLGFKLNFNYNSKISFYLFPISASKAFSACSSITIFCFRELIVYGRVYSTKTPPTTFQDRRSPFNGSILTNTKLFYLLYSYNSMYLLRISEY